jgi:glutathione S-transferase
MITVYAAYNLPFDGKGKVRDFRAMWALEELGMPYQCHWMDGLKGEHRQDPNRINNPFGKIPSLTDGELRLFETGAIVHYLYEKAGKLPKDLAARTQLLQWMFAAVNTVEMPLIEILRWDIFWTDRPGRDAQYPELLETAKTRISDLERGMGAKPYLLGAEFSAADIMMVTVLNFGTHKSELFAESAGIRAYIERCQARPAYQTALSKHLAGPESKAA